MGPRISFPRAYAFLASGVIDTLGEAGTVRALPGGDLGEDTPRVRFGQVVSLAGHVLVRRRDPNATEAVFNVRPVRCMFQVGDRLGPPTGSP